jgi:toxin ParE1/3/4
VSAKPVIPRVLAGRDIETAVDWYLREAGPDVASDFIDALQSAFGELARNAAAGSPRYGHELGLPGLRTCRVKRFPYLIFFIERADHIDVWRVLHERRDIPDRMQEG